MKDVIIACDFSSAQETLTFLNQFQNEKPFVKIGMELFYSEGKDIVKEIKRRSHKIFLDLKLHDIPNTVERSMRVLSDLDIDMVNIHASGTKAMMEAALKGLSTANHKPLLIAVTQLTSTDDTALHNELLIPNTMNDVVMHYAYNAKQSGLQGVVCSPWEANAVHTKCGDDFLTVTPGIRLTKSNDDQKRVMTPLDARKAGSDYIVVGRPITQSANPVLSYQECISQFLGGNHD